MKDGTHLRRRLFWSTLGCNGHSSIPTPARGACRGYGVSLILTP
jgi:hypothetical protein